MAAINDNQNTLSSAKKSKPIPISRSRPRSGSDSTLSDDESPPLQTPLSPSPPASFAQVSPSSSPSIQPKSPILSYFFPLPIKQSAPVQVPTSPLDSLSKAFGRSVPTNGAAFDQGDSSAVSTDAPEGMSYPPEIEPPLVRHARRLSTTWSQSTGGAAVRFSAAAAASGVAVTNGVAPGADGQDDRGSRLLRRLSLGTALNKNSNPPPSVPATDAPPIPPTPRTPTKKMRRQTLAAERPRRAPSPMGERILKGHFDGFS